MISLLILSLLQTPVEIAIDADGAKSKISPYIYGVNYADPNQKDWNTDWSSHYQGFTLAREGGNRTTAYNWETNASNAGNDYFNENDGFLSNSNEPGFFIRQFINAIQTTQSVALITIPTLGYVSADKDPSIGGDKDVSKTPDYIHTRFYPSYANQPGHVPTATPDLNDKAVYQSDFVTWVEKVKSSTSPVWFALDNEPDIWHSTHSKIELKPTTYARIIANNLEYAQMVKSIAPQSLVFGAVNFGWSGVESFGYAPDAGGRNFADTYLDAMQAADQKAGKRLVDVYDFHYYPEARGDNVRVSEDSKGDKPGTNAARVQSTRSLWDPTYIEESWITKSNGGKPIAILPEMKERIAKHDPGMKLSVTEYDFGARNSPSGAVAQADVLGIFGRYGVFAASHWGLTYHDVSAFAAFKSYINFDGQGSKFGDLGLNVAGENAAQDSVYAALDSKNPRRLTIVAINKTLSPMPLHIRMNGFKGKSVRSYLISEGHYEVPVDGRARLVADEVDITLPPLGIVTSEVLSF